MGDKGLVRNRRGKAFLKPLGKKSVTQSKYSAEDLRQFAAETQYMQGQYAETWEMACQFLIAARNTSTGESAAECCKRAEAMFDVPSGLLNPTRVSAAVHKTTVHDLEGTPPVQTRGVKAANPVRCAVVLVLVLLLPLLLLLAAAGTRRDLPDFLRRSFVPYSRWLPRTCARSSWIRSPKTSTSTLLRWACRCV